MKNPDLPQEILVEIFSKLPTKSVGRCRTLSKSWKTDLSTPNFIKQHLISRKQSIQQQNLAFVTKENAALATQDYTLCIITSPTKSDQFIDDKSFPDECYSILGSCNGLILVNGSEGLILMNPITRKRVNIEHRSRRGEGFFHRVYGLGYDSCADDYKIVGISGYYGRTFVDVYYVKNGYWGMLDHDCYPYDQFFPMIYKCEGGAFVNGVLHFLVCSWFDYYIAAFDLTTEVFSEIPFPEEFDDIHMGRMYGVSVVGGCLSIVDNDYYIGNGVAEVWIMKEYGVYESWVKLHIQAEEGDAEEGDAEEEDAEERNRHSIAAMLCYVEDGELLFLTYRGYLLACDLKSGTVRKVVLGERNCSFSHGMAFVDSLVSPE